MRRKLIFLFIPLFINCGREKIEEKGVIVRVGNEKLTKDDLKLFGVSEVNEELNKALIENWIKSTLFYLAAKREGLDKLPEMKRRLKWSERSILAQEYLSRKSSEITVSDEEIDEILRRERDLFSEGVKLLIVFFSDSVRGKGIKRALGKRGRRLEREIRKLRDDPSISVMQTDFVNLGSFLYEFEGIPKELKENIVRMKVGEISDVYPVEGGYVLVKMLSRSNLEIDTLETREFLRQVLLSRKRQELEDSLYELLKGEFEIVFEGGQSR
jgi:parvulin-like peptidyl-prolyl isomerase